MPAAQLTGRRNKGRLLKLPRKQFKQFAVHHVVGDYGLKMAASVHVLLVLPQLKAAMKYRVEKTHMAILQY